tara:strand:+ start:6139 stop:6411 length:273 start_codon:yes stop_codon:yes gene_type:complete
MIGNSAFTCGPFMSASMNVEQFTYDLYYSYLLSTTLTDLLESERKLEEAIKEGADEELIASLEIESRQNSGLIELTLTAGNPSGNGVEDA